MRVARRSGALKLRPVPSQGDGSKVYPQRAVYGGISAALEQIAPR